MKFLMSLLILGMFCSQAHSQEVSPENCDKPKTRSENAICLFPEVSDSDAVLNRTYNDILNEINEKCALKDGTCDRLKKLVKSTQVRWIQYRDNFCDLEVAHIANRDDADLSFGSCLISASKQKVEDLHIQQLNFRTIYKAK